MSRLTAFLVCILIAATAGVLLTGEITRYEASGWGTHASIPPEQYQNDGVYRTHFMASAALECRSRFGLHSVEACASHLETEAWMPNPCAAFWRGDRYADLMCHELGHMNGWPGDHSRS